jgi:hypothetical protein
VRHLPDCRRDAVADDEQIVVSLERKLVRIDRAFRLARRQRELLGKQAWYAEQTSGRNTCESGRDSVEKDPPRPLVTVLVHLVLTFISWVSWGPILIFSCATSKDEKIKI